MQSFLIQTPVRWGWLLLILFSLCGMAIAAKKTPVTPLFAIPRLDKVNIDGQAGDWGERGFRIDMLTQSPAVPRFSTAAGVTVRLGWDEHGLLALIAVQKKDTFIEAAKEEMLYTRNSVELYCADRQGGKNFYQVLISPGIDPEHPQLRYHFYDHRETAALKNVPLTLITARSVTPDGYLIEALLPWTNLGITPELGHEFACQIMVNDWRTQGGLANRLWFPRSGAFSNSQLMQRLQLANAPSTPVQCTATCGYADYLLHTNVTVEAADTLAGRKVTLRNEKRVLCTETITTTSPGHTGAQLSFPTRPSYTNVLVEVKGQASIMLMLPDYKLAHQQMLESVQVLFDPFDFHGVHFPPYNLQDAKLVTEALGHYTLTTHFYNAMFQPVDSAETPGRYGAVVQIQFDNKIVLKREITINRLPDSATTPDTVIATGTQTTALADKQWWYGLNKSLGVPAYHYKVLLPPDFNKKIDTHWPLLIFLHGSMSRQLSSQEFDQMIIHMKFTEFVPKKYPCIVVAPECPREDRGWNVTRLDDFLAEIFAKYPVDQNRVYLTGLSMGGMGTWAWGIAAPDHFAALVPLCGSGNAQAAASRLKTMPIWVFHGMLDPSVPFASGKAMVDALKAAGSPIKFTAYPNLDHNCWDTAYATPELYEWLFQCVRFTQSSHVEL